MMLPEIIFPKLGSKLSSFLTKGQKRIYGTPHDVILNPCKIETNGPRDMKSDLK